MSCNLSGFRALFPSSVLYLYSKAEEEKKKKTNLQRQQTCHIIISSHLCSFVYFLKKEEFLLTSTQPCFEFMQTSRFEVMHCVKKKKKKKKKDRKSESQMVYFPRPLPFFLPPLPFAFFCLCFSLNEPSSNAVNVSLRVFGA